MKQIPRYRILKNLSYIPRKPHGFYYNPKTGGSVKLTYHPDPTRSYTRNIIDPYHYKKQHERILDINKRADITLTKEDAIHIWSFVKLIVRNILDRTHELLLSNKSFIIEHEINLKNALNSNNTIDMELFKNFVKGVNGHLTVIDNMTSFMLNNLGYYRKKILYIMNLRIKNKNMFLKVSPFIKKYFFNIRRIIQNIKSTMIILKKDTEKYLKIVSKYNQDHFRVSKRTKKPSELLRKRDKRYVMDAFMKLKNTGDKDFRILLQMIKLSERQEHSVEMNSYKRLISRSNQRLP